MIAHVCGRECSLPYYNFLSSMEINKVDEKDTTIDSDHAIKAGFTLKCVKEVRASLMKIAPEVYRAGYECFEVYFYDFSLLFIQLCLLSLS